MRARDQIRELNKQLDACEQRVRLERQRADNMQELVVKRDAELEAAVKRENAARHENFRLKLRLDAVLYALVMAQLEIRKGQKDKRVEDELFLANGQEPPPGSAEAALRGSGFTFVDGEWRLAR